MTTTPTRILLDAVHKWGALAQINTAIEECGELIVVLQHQMRGRVTADEVIEEIADVQIMCEQLALIYSVAGVREARTRKLARLKRRLEGGAE